MSNDERPKLKRFSKLEIDDGASKRTKGSGTLTRFANLDIDGIPKPKRKRRKAPAAAPAETPRVAQYTAPPASAERSRRPAPTPARTQLRPGPPVRALGREMMPPGAIAGVRTIEVDLARGTRTERQTWHLGGLVEPVERRTVETREPGRPRYNGEPPYPHRRTTHREPPPDQDIELTPMAAHQVRLMARESGWLGCGLRVMVSGSGEHVDYDFAFEPRPGPDDEIIVSQGIPIYVDSRSLEAIRGSRITFDDLPGATGFRLG